MTINWLSGSILFMTDLTIEEIEEILGVSYPTALRFAQKYGKVKSGGRKWLVPAQAVADVIETEQQRINEKRQRLVARIAA